MKLYTNCSQISMFFLVKTKNSENGRWTVVFLCKTTKKHTSCWAVVNKFRGRGVEKSDFLQFLPLEERIIHNGIGMPWTQTPAASPSASRPNKKDRSHSFEAVGSFYFCRGQVSRPAGGETLPLHFVFVGAIHESPALRIRERTLTDNIDTD